MARRLCALSPVACAASMSAVGVAALGTMEALERGSLHADAFVGAFGSAPVVGLAIVMATAWLVALAMRGFARWIAAATPAIAHFISTFFGRSVTLRTTHRRQQRIARGLVRIVRTDHRRIGPDRAPPALLA